MKLADFAKQLPENFTEQEFVDLMKQVIDLKAIEATVVLALATDASLKFEARC